MDTKTVEHSFATGNFPPRMVFNKWHLCDLYSLWWFILYLWYTGTWTTFDWCTWSYVWREGIITWQDYSPVVTFLNYCVNLQIRKFYFVYTSQEFGGFCTALYGENTYIKQKQESYRFRVRKQVLFASCSNLLYMHFIWGVLSCVWMLHWSFNTCKGNQGEITAIYI